MSAPFVAPQALKRRRDRRCSRAGRANHRANVPADMEYSGAGRRHHVRPGLCEISRGYEDSRFVERSPRSLLPAFCSQEDCFRRYARCVVNVPTGVPVAADVTRRERIRIEQHSAGGLLWFASWLFTIGFLNLTFWQGLAALVIWPYYIGVRIAAWLASAGPWVSP